MYDRKGEHARPGPEAAGTVAAEGHAQDAPAPTARRAASKLVRRLLAAGGALGAVVAAVAVFGFIGDRAPRAIEYEVHPAREPVIVTLNWGPAGRVVLGSTQERDRCVDEAARSVLDAGRSHPDRLIVIELESPPISFASLSTSDRQELQRAIGSSADHRYESTLAGLLERVVKSAGRGGVSVLGLPVEPREAGISASARTNGCYRGVMNRLDCLVSAHVLYRGNRSLSEDELVQQALPEALRQRGGRPVLFRQNKAWCVLVERGEADRRHDAARRLVLGDAG